MIFLPLANEVLGSEELVLYWHLTPFLCLCLWKSVERNSFNRSQSKPLIWVLFGPGRRMWGSFRVQHEQSPSPSFPEVSSWAALKQHQFIQMDCSGLQVLIISYQDALLFKHAFDEVCEECCLCQRGGVSWSSQGAAGQDLSCLLFCPFHPK